MTGQRWTSHLKYLRCEKWAPWSRQSHASTGGDRQSYNEGMMICKWHMMKFGEKLTLLQNLSTKNFSVTCCSVRRSQHLTLSTDKWYYVVEISLPVRIWESSFILLNCMYIWCHAFVCLLWNFIFSNLTASYNPALSTFWHKLQWPTGPKCNVRWTLQQLQHCTQLNTETWNYA
jgi:hypothetical protein